MKGKEGGNKGKEGGKEKTDICARPGLPGTMANVFSV